MYDLLLGKETWRNVIGSGYWTAATLALWWLFGKFRAWYRRHPDRARRWAVILFLIACELFMVHAMCSAGRQVRYELYFRTIFLGQQHSIVAVAWFSVLFNLGVRLFFTLRGFLLYRKQLDQETWAVAVTQRANAFKQCQIAMAGATEINELTAALDVFFCSLVKSEEPIAQKFAAPLITRRTLYYLTTTVLYFWLFLYFALFARITVGGVIPFLHY